MRAREVDLRFWRGTHFSVGTWKNMEHPNLHKTFPKLTIARALPKCLFIEVYLFYRIVYGLEEPCKMAAEVHHYMWDAVEHLDKAFP